MTGAEPNGVVTFLLTQGVLGICVLVLGVVIRYVYKQGRDDVAAERARHATEMAAKEAALAQRDAEIHALYEKVTTEIVPLMTRSIIALERKRS